MSTDYFIKQNCKKLEGILAFCLPSLLFLALCLVNNITPFGDKTFLYEDMKQQYIDYYAYYRSVLHGQDNFIYSIHSGLGSNMLGTWTYYLTSPFLLIFAIIPESLFPTTVTFLTMLKISSIGFTTWFFLQRLSAHDSRSLDIASIICSTAFAYSGWVVANMTNSMWLDAVIVMPLFASAYLMIIRNEKRALPLFVISIMALIYLNYYIAAMVLLFAGLFTLLLLLFREVKITRALRLLEGVILGIVLDLWILIPTFISLTGSNKDHFGESKLLFEQFLPKSEAAQIDLSPLKIILKLYTGSYDSIEIMEGLPNVYFGITLLVFALLFFFNKKIRMKDRLLALISLFTVVLFFCNKYLNILAHGMTEPYGYLYRYSFIFSFICITLAYIEIANIEPGNYRTLIAVFFITSAMIFVSYKSGNRLITERLLFQNLVFIAASFAITFFLKSYSKRKDFYLLFVGLILAADLALNFSVVYASSSMMGRGVREYTADVKQVNTALDKIRPDNKESYRVESLVPMSSNESLHFGYKGVTAYNSLLKTENRLLLYRMGFNDNGLYADYDAGNTRTADALLGVKYIITDGNTKPLEGQTAFSDNIIENSYVEKDTVISDKNVDELLDHIDNKENPFEVQKTIMETFGEPSTDLFDYADIRTLNSSSESAQYKITPRSDGELYFYMNRVNLEERVLEIYVQDEFVSMYGNASCQKVINLGHHEAGDMITLTIETDGKAVPDEPVVVTENIDALKTCLMP